MSAPLILPSSGFQLREGFQYATDKYFRRAVREEYGYVLPTEVTCLRRRYPAERAEHKVTNLETGEVREWVEDRPAVNATFQYFAQHKKFTFCVSCEALAEVRALNAEADKAADEVRVIEKKPKEKKERIIDSTLLALIEGL